MPGFALIFYRGIVFSIAFLTSFSLATPPISPSELEKEIETGITKSIEFSFLKKEAERLGIRVWLFGGTAASFAHFAKWHNQKKLEYEHGNIFRSNQDLDIVIDGTSAQAETLERVLIDNFPHMQGNKTAWEVRTLRVPRGHKAPLLNNPDFLNQNTDSQSTGLIEVTQPTPPEGRIRDLFAWDQKETNPFMRDTIDGTIRFYSNAVHESTSRAREGLNPPILSVIRFLTKVVQFNLELKPIDREKIRTIIDKFSSSDIANLPRYVGDWIERNGKKLIQNAHDIEAAMKLLDELGLKQKLIRIRNDQNSVQTLAWWLNREPLTSKPLGTVGLTARELGIVRVAHDTGSIEALDSIVRSPHGTPNIFVSRAGAAGETAREGNGFYTSLGDVGARKTLITVRFDVNPEAREGVDFFRSESGHIVFLNRSALKVIPEEGIRVTPIEYFHLLTTEPKNPIFGNLALLSRLKKRLASELALTSQDERQKIIQIILDAYQKDRVTGLYLLRNWFDVFPQAHVAFSDLFQNETIDYKAWLFNEIFKTNPTHRQTLEWLDFAIQSREPKLTLPLQVTVFSHSEDLSNKIPAETLIRLLDLHSLPRKHRIPQWAMDSIVSKMDSISPERNKDRLYAFAAHLPDAIWDVFSREFSKFAFQKASNQQAKLVRLVRVLAETMLNDSPTETSRNFALAVDQIKKEKITSDTVLATLLIQTDNIKQFSLNRPVIETLIDLGFTEEQLHRAYFQMFDSADPENVALRLSLIIEAGRELITPSHPRYGDQVAGELIVNYLEPTFSKALNVQSPTPRLVDSLCRAISLLQSDVKDEHAKLMAALMKFEEWKIITPTLIHHLLGRLSAPVYNTPQTRLQYQLLRTFDALNIDPETHSRIFFERFDRALKDRSSNPKVMDYVIRAGVLVPPKKSPRYHEFLIEAIDEVAYHTGVWERVAEVKVGTPKLAERVAARLVEYSRYSEAVPEVYKTLLDRLNVWKIKNENILGALFTSIGANHGTRTDPQFIEAVQKTIQTLEPNSATLGEFYFSWLKMVKGGSGTKVSYRLPDHSTALVAGFRVLPKDHPRMREFLEAAMENGRFYEVVNRLQFLPTADVAFIEKLLTKVMVTSAGLNTENHKWSPILKEIRRWNVSSPAITRSLVIMSATGMVNFHFYGSVHDELIETIKAISTTEQIRDAFIHYLSGDNLDIKKNWSSHLYTLAEKFGISRAEIEPPLPHVSVPIVAPLVSPPPTPNSKPTETDAVESDHPRTRIGLLHKCARVLKTFLRL